MSQQSAVIELRDVRKTYGSVEAVKSIDLEVYEGEFFSLLGPSGCGKTTTLRMISGLESPTKGSIHLFNDNVTDVPPQERKTNLVFQNLALFPHMSVGENIEFGLKREGMTSNERDAQIQKMLEVVDLEGYRDRPVTDLSGGQQQRVALARSLAKEPAVLLLDEPLASLDRKLRQRMQFELKEIQSRLGMTFFYVTHDQDVAMTMSDRMAVMRDGDITQVGSPSQIYDEPTNAFVADFIGDANFIEGSVTETDRGTMFVTSDSAFPIEASGTANGSQMVIRPENLEIGEAANAAEFTFLVRVTERINQGHTVLFTVELDDGTTMTVRQKNRHVEEGDETMIGFNRNDYTIVNV